MNELNLICDAAASAAPAAGGAGGMIQQLAPIFIIMIVFMFFMSRGQKKREMKRQEMLNKMGKDTEVMLTSGIFGKIVEVADDSFVIEVAFGVKIKVAKNAVANAVEANKEEVK